jgi:hypothetical protein
MGVLPGQPLPAWALEDDDADGDADAEVEPETVEEPRLRSLATAVENDDPEAMAAAAAEFDASELGTNGEEPINRGLLLKFLSSVRS